MGWRNVVIGSLLWWSTLPRQLAFSPPHPSLHTLLFYAPLLDELQRCVFVCMCEWVCEYEEMHANTVKVKHFPVKHLLPFRQTLKHFVVQGESITLLFPYPSSSTWQKITAVSHVSLTRDLSQRHVLVCLKHTQFVPLKEIIFLSLKCIFLCFY